MSRHIKKPQSALLLGAGYVARALAPVLQELGWSVHVTTRSGETSLTDVACHKFNGRAPKALETVFQSADLILSSIPPFKDGADPALDALGHLTPQASWIGYLSATSVYGNREGKWAFEGEPPSPTLERGRARAEAEIAWIETQWPVHIFRQAIYNLADGHPAPPQDVLDYAAGLIDMPPPPRTDISDPSLSDV